MFIAIHPETGARVPIEPGYVVTGCPCCGAEHTVDIVRLAQEMKDFDLYGTAVYCPECSAVRRENKVISFPPQQ